MSSITIHKLDKELEKRIRLEAKKTGQSLNKTIQETLRKAFGLSLPTEQKTNRLKKYCGIWKAQEVVEFQKATSAFEVVDPQDWS